MIELEDRAYELAQRILIADSHIDVPYRLKHRMEDVGVRTAAGNFDYPRARQGGLDLAFMSIFVPARLQDSPGESMRLADELIDMMQGLTRRHPDKFAITASVAAARSAGANGVIGLALGLENGSPLEGDLANLRYFHDRGVRYITLTHSENNEICDSSYAGERRWHGLSPFGREVVAEMNRLGLMIDVSHVSDGTFEQIIELSAAPILATHSSCRHFTPGFERNLSDEMIRSLARHGGVVQINFGSSFISDGYRVRNAAERDAVSGFREAGTHPPDSPAERAFIAAYRERHPNPLATVADVADHIDHVVRLVGVDHVGLGSDFDGVGDSLPAELADVSHYPNLIRVLLERGYIPQQIEQIAAGNLLRVWSDVVRVAGQAG